MVADDTTHVSGKLTPEQIGEAIRHKKFGVDMRETIAQGFEYMLSWWELVQKLDKDFDTLSTEHKEDVKQLQSEITAFKEDYDKQVGLFQQALSDQHVQVSKNKSDINNLGVDFRNHLDQDKIDKDGIDARLKKLEDAVFGLNPVEIDNPPVPDYPSGGLVGINSDDRTRKDKNRW